MVSSCGSLLNAQRVLTAGSDFLWLLLRPLAIACFSLAKCKNDLSGRCGGKKAADCVKAAVYHTTVSKVWNDQCNISIMSLQSRDTARASWLNPTQRVTRANFGCSSWGSRYFRIRLSAYPLSNRMKGRCHVCYWKKRRAWVCAVRQCLQITPLLMWRLPAQFQPALLLTI